jgi:5-methylcytosine-specific restriction endonuclease McrA
MNWRNTRDYRVWRANVIRRDKRCQICGSLQNRQAHHKNHATYFPEERFDEDNGVCLCKDCHIQFHNNFKRSNRTKCTKYDFENFKDLVTYLKGKFNVKNKG